MTIASEQELRNWREIYESRLTTSDEALKSVKSGNRVYLTGNASVPQELLAALVRRAPQLRDVELFQPLSICSADYVEPGMEKHIRVNAFFISHTIRQAVNEGRADFTPSFLSEQPLMFKNGHLTLDVALAHVSPPDEQGYCSLGAEAGLAITSVECGKTIIAQVNRQMPRTMGDTAMHVSRIQHLVEFDAPLAQRAMGDEADVATTEKIAGHIAELIPDGATMQLGIGSIPDAVLKHLHTKKDLGIHSELISDGVIELVEKGVINNSRKTLHPGKIICGFLLGTDRVYQWTHNNPLLEMRRSEYVNDPFVIAQNDRMVAVNSAIEVDLTGQVCADSIGPRLYSAVGGQLDFIYGASRSKGGVPIITMPSTSTMSDGTVISKIVPMLKQGAGVVTSRNHVHFVVTEYGVASLYGKSIRQRTEALIAIAHPEFRQEIARQARELHYL